MGGFVPAALLAEFCQTDKGQPFPLWQDGHVGICFNQLVLGTLPHTVMAAVAGFYLGVARCRSAPAPISCGWTLRLLSSMLAWLLFVADVAVAVVAWQADMYPDALASSFGAVAWLLHAGAVAALPRGKRGPRPLTFSVLLGVPYLVFTFMFYLKRILPVTPPDPLQLTRLVLVAIQVFSVPLYLLGAASPLPQGPVLHIQDEAGLPLITEEDTGNMVAEDGSSCFSRLFYLWLTPLLQRGRRGELDRATRVYHLPRRLRTSLIRRHFHQSWAVCQRGTANHGTAAPDPWPRPVPNFQEELPELEGDVSLLRVLHVAFGGRYYALGVMKLAVNMLRFCGPLLLSLLVGFMEDAKAPVSRGAWYCVALFASALFCAILQNVFAFQVSKVALSARAALVSAIYSKALRVGGADLARLALGEVVNLMSADTDRVVNFFNSFHELWSLPFQLAIALYLLYLQVGVAFLGGLGVALLLVPFNKFLASRILSNNQDMLRYKDARVKLMTEILFGIRVIKFYSWEAHFSHKVSECRRGELAHLKAVKYLDAMCVYTWAALPVLISILTFLTFVLLGNQLTAAKVFTTLALVGMLIVPLNAFPWVLNGILEAKVSLERIQRFFKLTNQDPQAYFALVWPEDDRTAVLLSQGTFSWKGPQDNTEREHGTLSGGLLVLHNLNLNIRKGSLTVVVGKVGCGKSSFLAAISGELSRHSGVVYVADRERGLGLVTQEPWIQHASVRDNILFGKSYDASFYRAVVEACALTDDLAILPDGDRTEVGENGVTLSGGQKARLALARAVYMDKDVYLLDDPLAAVDAQVARHLMRNCILELLAGKTRILCTHRIELVNVADMVALMENGTITKIGSPAEILPLLEAAPKQHNTERDCEKKGSEDEEQKIAFSELHLDDDVSDRSGLEKMQAGSLSWKVYQTYWVAVGGVLATSIMMSLLAMQASKNVSDWWLSHWISALKSNSSADSNRSCSGSLGSPHLVLFTGGSFTSSMSPLPKPSSEVRFYLAVYGGLAGANTVFTALRAFLFAYGAICAATAIHDRLLNRVIKATVSFFDTTPLGRILNRFSSDVYSVDDSLPFILNILLANVFSLLGTLAVMSLALPWLLLALPPLALLYFSTQRFYRHTSRELKRLCSVTLSPVYSHFSETLGGLATIRASRSSARFEEESVRRLEENQRCLFLSNAATQWLDIRLQLIGVAVVTSLAIIAVIQHSFNVVDPGLVGLSLSYALSITALLSGLISSFTQTEMQLVSVERAHEYSSQLPEEPQQQNPQLGLSWPQHGIVEFRHVVLAYREGLPNALDGVSFIVRAGEKVGIVGRTGSGKSSLFAALFRMVEVNGGEILLDGLDVSSVGLTQLRSRLAIIPQDPFLFSGTVRENLDPCGRHQDQQLLEVLDQCHLTSVVNAMGGLDAELQDRGRTFSLGQRQLLCLSRALLTQAKVLCVDEATASVDQKTDKLLQKTIADRFRDKTVLTIAHRINTIMDCERVLVMHAGKVVDFDMPAALCQKDNSVFQRLLGGEGKTAGPKKNI
ncbi:ATP-binding cassette sub-family C member 10 isoform X2 [Corythoichthys intestinalis]|uniref:ATP-binding cassette sub-family C member 10 isoform X2 n=1 Tax=Corythoichthys intestinalis TaxID=161448 RepID=UPI0025A5F555|nr:ATP-binding cassette sub-family C member 10 isoform X2 [Corythoichthys intestinalis]